MGTALEGRLVRPPSDGGGGEPPGGQGQEVVRAGGSKKSLPPACQALDLPSKESSNKSHVGELLTPMTTCW